MKGFNSTTWERGVGFSGIEVGSDWQIFLPASLKHRHICQNHWLSPNFFAFFLATVSSATFVGEMLCNSVGFNWLACPAGKKKKVFQRGDSSRERRARGGGGSSRVAGSC